MTTEEFIAEVTSGGFQKYEEAGLIDHTSLRTWLKNELKRFGSNIMNKEEEIITIKNNSGVLPDNFWQLNVAVKCEPSHVVTSDDENVLQDSFFFRERLEGQTEWNNMSESLEDVPTKFIREEFYFKKAKADFYYHKPTYLKLMKGFNRKFCSGSCANLQKSLVSSSPYEVNIVGSRINTNFKTGTIYMQYMGLSKDENGDLLIPETQHNRLKEYLRYFCRARILEELITGKDDDVSNLLQYYNGQADKHFSLALTETKMEALGKNWAKVIRNKQRAETLKYEVMLPTR